MKGEKMDERRRWIGATSPLFERSPSGSLHNADGRITSANPAAQRILGLTLEQAQAR